MSKFCSHCGKEVNENAVVCVNCGVAISDIIVNKKKKPGRGLSIASMVLGIIAIFYGMCSLLLSFMIAAFNGFYYLDEKIAFSIGINFFPLVLSITGISLGIASMFKIKNGMNIAGIILNSITILFSIISIALVIIV